MAKKKRLQKSKSVIIQPSPKEKKLTKGTILSLNSDKVIHIRVMFMGRYGL